MPRLPTKLLLRAHSQDPLLPLLLRECRDLHSAQNELRWLRSQALAECSDFKFRHRRQTTIGSQTPGWRTRLRSMCQARAKGKPLQYILGDQPFGDLEILCRKGVLIPRAETESYTLRASRLILKYLRQESRLEPLTATIPSSLRILDLCTGTGCIPLLLHQLLSPHIPKLEIVGVDISQKAVSLARRNLEHNVHLGLLPKRAISEIRFLKGNVLEGSSDPASLESVLKLEGYVHQYTDRECGNNDPKSRSIGGSWDILISNPPYISPVQFGNGTTARSVRHHEPRLALVPPIAVSGSQTELRGKAREQHMGPDVNSQTGFDAHADTFYPRLISLSSLLNTKLSIFECGDPLQARRVAELAARTPPTTNHPDPAPEAGNHEFGDKFKVEVWRCDDEFGHGDDGYNNPRQIDTIEEDQGARAVVLKKGSFWF